MTGYKDSRRWENGNNELLLIAILLALVVALTGAYFFIRYALCVAPMLFVSVLLIIRNFQGQMEQQVWKAFFVEKQVAYHVVENVLKEKGLPYQLFDGGFELNGLTIQIRYFVARHPQLNGSRITFKPVTIENMPLVYSLQEKIDEAFLPKGL